MNTTKSSTKEWTQTKPDQNTSKALHKQTKNTPNKQDKKPAKIINI